jgi:serine/threonine protein phosphatase 1
MTLIIGDIHGCYDELQALLDLAAVSDDEPILAIGDILDKGEQPGQVLDFFLNHPQASSLRGNHEERHLRWVIQHEKPPLAQQITRERLGEVRYDQAIEYMRQMPLYADLPDILVIHAYLECGIPLAYQDTGLLTGTDYELPLDWHEQYTDEKPLAFGHKDYSGGKNQAFVIPGRIYALDSRCVTGGQLSALKLPEWDIISVPARANHWQNLVAGY